MDKPIEQMSLEEIEAEREKIAAERAELERSRSDRGLPSVPAQSMAEFARELADSSTSDTNRELFEAIAEDAEAEAETGSEDEEPAPAPWPHQHMVHCGLELDVRIPNQSALMAISMLQQLDGLGELQMDIFNTFLANHLSRESLAKVIKEFTRPETEMSMQSLVQALVYLRTEVNAD